MFGLISAEKADQHTLEQCSMLRAWGALETYIAYEPKNGRELHVDELEQMTGRYATYSMLIKLCYRLPGKHWQPCTLVCTLTTSDRCGFEFECEGAHGGTAALQARFKKHELLLVLGEMVRTRKKMQDGSIEITFMRELY